ncbi:hypothetical protein MAA8898_03882 [Maliponia aquimaris]|uniref:Patched domain-containing protein n=2 Tax=Maliponia aquimaris TaxID=1673631 RepID=A0A238KZB1_9RHOB|nr:hypothetical protein MAA8898_03882 [Maliponia aquimaris]
MAAEVRLASLADPAPTVQSVSLAQLQREISAALVQDQLGVTPLATLVCIALALTGIPFDPLMNIAPTVVLVLGIADGVHVFQAMQRHATEGDMRHAFRCAVMETMPAVILVALTTALAFFCVLFVGPLTLPNVAIAGAAGPRAGDAGGLHDPAIRRAGAVRGGVVAPVARACGPQRHPCCASGAAGIEAAKFQLESRPDARLRFITLHEDGSFSASRS